MIIILSPAKTFNKDLQKVEPNNDFSLKTEHLLKILKSLTVDQIENELSVSNKIAKEVSKYFANFKNEYKAIYLYGGTAFKYLNAKEISEEKLKKVYILSAFYGLLNGLDIIGQYRLDIKDKIIDETLYNYWFEEINKEINSLNENMIINLSSGEYTKLLDLTNKNITTINFSILKNNKLTSSSMMLKKMRGLMANYLLNNHINTLTEIKNVKIEGFEFCEEYSKTNLLMFIKK